MLNRLIILLTAIQLAFAPVTSPAHVDLELAPSGVTGGVITGDLDLGQIVESAAFSALGAGLTSGIDLADLVVTGLSDTALLGMGEQFTVAAVSEASLDAAILSGLSSAVYGTDFASGFLSGLTSSTVSLAIADLQTGIGDLGLDEGGFNHAVLLAMTDCLAAEAQGADCASGVAGGLAQSLYAGGLTGTDLSDAGSRYLATLGV